MLAVPKAEHLDVIHFDEAARWRDVSRGTAEHAIVRAVLRKYPELKGTLFELPGACGSRSNASRKSQSERALWTDPPAINCSAHVGTIPYYGWRGTGV